MKISKVKQLIIAAGFLLPGVILFLTFFLVPMLYSFRISFYDWNFIHLERSEWVGLQNYISIMLDPIFQRAVLNTAIYALVTVPGQLIMGIIIAILINQDIRGKTFFRVMYYLPVITSWVIVTLLFEYMFSGQAGLINYIIKDILQIVDHNIRWLADPILAMVPIHLLGIWKGMGWTAIIFLAGLQAVPQQLYEAAEVDGAGWWKKFTKITLPLLKPTTTFLIVVLSIGAFNAYISNLLMTNGGNPMDKTHFILTLMYEETFSNMNFGSGSAISFILTIFIFIFSVIQIRMLNRNQGGE
ncbi:MAG: sugar ABC transporter permease [Anaerolineales bacterium]|nr:sugar ABC transporter permease [Anaerolineales bacterium]